MPFGIAPGEFPVFGLTVVIASVMLTFLWSMLPHAAADVYDFLIVRMTAKWYAAVLARLEPGSVVLDVGIGTAGALLHGGNASTLRSRQLKVVGVDYEACYIAKAKAALEAAKLSERVALRCASIYDTELRSTFVGANRFDAAYFSGSLTLMPDPAAALKCAAAMTRSGGLVYVTQTFQNRRTPLMGTLKPLLRRFTSVDFGRLTYHAEVQQIVARAGMEVVEDVPVPGSIDNRWQTARLLVLRNRKGN